VANERQAATRLKRGGGVVVLSLGVEGAERELAGPALASADDVEAWFHREWVRTLFTRAVAALEARCREQGRTAAFAVFRRYDLEGEDGDRPTYEALGRELGLPVTQVTNHLSAMRRELRREVLDALRARSPRATRSSGRRRATSWACGHAVSLSDAALARLAEIVDAPDLAGDEIRAARPRRVRGGMGTVWRAHDRELGREGRAQG
jgi:hypothetical protein